MPCMDSAAPGGFAAGFEAESEDGALFGCFILDTTAGFRVGLGAGDAFATGLAGFAAGFAGLGAGLVGLVMPGILEWSMPCID